jgi:hypothetical protein
MLINNTFFSVWPFDKKPMTTSLIFYMRYNTKIQVVGVGIILIQLSCQITKVISVKHVPTLENLLSMSKSTNKGHSSMQFFGNHCVMKSWIKTINNLFSIANKIYIYPFGAGVRSSSNKSNVTSSL